MDLERSSSYAVPSCSMTQVEWCLLHHLTMRCLQKRLDLALHLDHPHHHLVQLGLHGVLQVHLAQLHPLLRSPLSHCLGAAVGWSSGNSMGSSSVSTSTQTSSAWS